MTTRELKEKYFEFFKQNGHKAIPSASLIPENDPGALFTSAGMHPLVPYLLGEKHPAGDKLVNVQKCIRTGDIDEVGDDVHLTFFEMLGNWGLGSYWKKEAIEMSWEFLTSKKWLGLDKKKISVSVFKGEGDIPPDKESPEIWASRVKDIKFLGKKDNFWGQAAGGPCGPCSEMFYEGIEIWNDVFMEYNKTADGNYEPLKQKNVDTGMGVERTVAILSGKKSVFDVEPLKSIVGAVKKMAKDYDERSARIIADHLRAATFIITDGVIPSNIERGYVVRRLIRRAVEEGRNIGIGKDYGFTHFIGTLVIDLMKEDYPELLKNKDFIIEQLTLEEEKFNKIDAEAEKTFDDYMKKNGITPIMVTKIGPDGKISYIANPLILPRVAFKLHSEKGLSLSTIKRLAKDKHYVLDERGLEELEGGLQKEFKEHISRSAISAGKFKSGLADNSEQVTKLHTATHLLLAALRKVLGEHVYQKGSNITAERLRLDFSHSQKMTAEQIKKVEDAVNEVIKKNLPVNCNEVSLEKAKEIGAMGVFESKYGDRVKVYSVGTPDCPYSCEICAGPHIQKTGELGHFEILKEEASSAGVRRIKAIVV